MDDLQLVNKVEAELKRISCEAHISPQYFAHMLVDEKIVDDFATTLAVRTVLTLMGRIVSTDQDEAETIDKVEEIGYYQRPKTWWDGLKCVIISSIWLNWMFPDNAINDWVKYEMIPKNHTFVTRQKKEIRHYHMCPLPEGISTDKNIVNFLNWQQEFTGTQQEYILLRIIAKECVLMMSDTTKIPLMPQSLLKAVSDYLIEITKQPDRLDKK